MFKDLIKKKHKKSRTINHHQRNHHQKNNSLKKKIKSNKPYKN